jgi:hypothetical protein
MTDARSRARFTQETKPSQLISQIFLSDDFQRHGTSKIDIECLISDAHRTAAQFHWLTVFVR